MVTSRHQDSLLVQVREIDLQADSCPPNPGYSAFAATLDFHKLQHHPAFDPLSLCASGARQEKA